LNILMDQLQVWANEEDNSKASHNRRDKSGDTEPSSNTRASLKDKWEHMVLKCSTKVNLKANLELVVPNFNVKASPKAKSVK